MTRVGKALTKSKEAGAALNSSLAGQYTEKAGRFHALAAFSTATLFATVGVIGAIVAAPSTAAASPLTPFAYVDDEANASVFVINTSTNEVVGKIPDPYNYFGEVAVAPDGSFGYVTNQGGSGGINVSAFDTTTDSVFASRSLSQGSLGVAISPDGLRAYLTNVLDKSVSVIDTETNTSVATIPIPVGIEPWGVAVSPNGQYVYVVNLFTNENEEEPQTGHVSVIDTTTNTVISTITVGALPHNVAFTPDGSVAYVVNTDSNNVSVINTSSKAVVATLPVGLNPFGVAISPDGAFAYVAVDKEEGEPGAVAVIETATNTVVSTIAVGEEPINIAFTPDGSRAYVTNANGGSVSVIDTALESVIATIPAGRPTGIAISPPIEGPHSLPLTEPPAGGGGSGGSSGATGPAPAPTPTPVPRRKHLKCKKGFKKVKRHGKAKCVKVGKHGKRKHAHKNLGRT